MPTEDDVVKGIIGIRGAQNMTEAEVQGNVAALLNANIRETHNIGIVSTTVENPEWNMPDTTRNTRIPTSPRVCGSTFKMWLRALRGPRGW